MSTGIDKVIVWIILFLYYTTKDNLLIGFTIWLYKKAADNNDLTE